MNGESKGPVKISSTTTSPLAEGKTFHLVGEQPSHPNGSGDDTMPLKPKRTKKTSVDHVDTAYTSKTCVPDVESGSFNTDFSTQKYKDILLTSARTEFDKPSLDARHSSQPQRLTKRRHDAKIGKVFLFLVKIGRAHV